MKKRSRIIYRHSAAATTERIIRAASVMQITRTRMVFRRALLFWKPAISNDLLAIRWGQYSTFRPLRASPGQPEGVNSSFVHGRGKQPDAKFTKYSHRAQTLPEGVG